MSNLRKFKSLAKEIRACTLCAEHLPLGPRPVFQADPEARILIVGQAPGTAVHESGVPFDDPSGERLRGWMGVDTETFYNPKKVALVPMGFCYPGKVVAANGRGGDKPPRPECAQTWRAPLLGHLRKVELTIVLGRYAMDWHLQVPKKSTLTQIVADWAHYWPTTVPLPHPSPRNLMWLRRNPFVEQDIVPRLQRQIKKILAE